jgi:sugar lactone lactonase YvrE
MPLATSRTLLASLAIALIGFTPFARSAEPKTVIGLKRPESAVVGPDGRIYVTTIGEAGKDGDGAVVAIDRDGKVTTFASGLDDPKGMVAVGDQLFLTDVTRVLKVDTSGKVEVHAAPGAFPRKPMFLNDIASDGRGNLFVSDMGDRMGKKGAVYRINPIKQVELILDCENSMPPINAPNGLLSDDADHLFVADFGLGDLYRLDLNTKAPERVGGGFGGADGLARDDRGRLFITDWKNGRVFVMDSILQPARLVTDKFRAAADLTISADGKTLLIPDMTAGTLVYLPMP